MVSLLF